MQKNDMVTVKLKASSEDVQPNSPEKGAFRIDQA